MVRITNCICYPSQLGGGSIPMSALWPLAARAQRRRAAKMVVGSTSTAIRRKIPNFRGTQKSHNPLSEVAVRDMKTGEITPVSYKPGII